MSRYSSASYYKKKVFIKCIKIFLKKIKTKSENKVASDMKKLP